MGLTIPTGIEVNATLVPRGSPIANLDRYSGNDVAYKTVVSWTVSTGKNGELKEVSMISDQPTKTHFRLTIAGQEQFKDKLLQTSLALPFPENKLTAGQQVTIETKSTDGTAIVVDGSISGREY